MIGFLSQRQILLCFIRKECVKRVGDSAVGQFKILGHSQFGRNCLQNQRNVSSSCIFPLSGTICRRHEDVPKAQTCKRFNSILLQNRQYDEIQKRWISRITPNYSHRRKKMEDWENLLGNDEKKNNIGSIPTRKENIFTIPNLLSFGRILAAPYIGGLILNGQYLFASSLLVVAGITDILDGYIARRWPSQKSAFGTALDPLGDKILVSVLTVTLTKAGMLPLSLAAIIIGRDAALIVSVFYLRYRTCPPPLTLKRFFDPTLVNTKLNPTAISKYNTVLQIAALWASLTAPLFQITDSPVLIALYVVTGITTVWSGASYIFDKSTVQILKDDQ